MPPKKTTTKIIGMPWDFASLMNEAIRSLPEYPLQKREHIWASELGGDFCSRYLKMHGHKYTNPPNERSRRKFISGHIFEWIVQLVLTMCGVLKQTQLRGVVELPGALKVSGKLDFIAGGDVNWEEARLKVEMLRSMFGQALGDMPPIIMHSVDSVLSRMEMMFSRVPLQEVLLECKSVSAFVSDLMEKTGKPRDQHTFQILHYLMANKMKTGQLLYINKDSFYCHQFEVTPTRNLLMLYKEDVYQMTDYYNASGSDYLKNLPPKAPELIFYEDEFRFAKNTQVEYSHYLTMLYGYKDFDEFNERWKSTVTSFNRVFKRHVLEGSTCRRKGGKDYTMKLTPSNIEVIEEAKKIFPEWDKYIMLARKKGVFSTEDEEE